MRTLEKASTDHFYATFYLAGGLAARLASQLDGAGQPAGWLAPASHLAAWRPADDQPELGPPPRTSKIIEKMCIDLVVLRLHKYTTNQTHAPNFQEICTITFSDVHKFLDETNLDRPENA